jgi:glycosyltransferase involved in cell wall biosynthesis
MNILWFTWKDLTHPRAGGAEVVNEELAERLVADGHEVTFIVGSYEGAAPEETTAAGYKIIRVGGRYSVYWKAFRYYRNHLYGLSDLIIDEINTLPFFTKYYAGEPTIMFAHMLCRRIWFYQMRFPFSLIGFLAEPIYLKLVNNGPVITVSESSKRDLQRVGFKPKNINIISEGIHLKPLSTLPAPSSKATYPTVLSLGNIRPMKRTLHQLRAFEISKAQLPELRLEIAGDRRTRYGQKVLRAIENSPYADDITYHGRVSEREKIKLLRRSHLTMQTSIKEGWGLTVTEAASQGTPAVVYDTDGLRDSVRHGKTGIITKQNNPQQLAKSLATLLSDQKRYARIRKNAWQWSKTITFDKSYQQFLKTIS